MKGYWSSITQHRLRRRRVLTLTGASLAGAALLAACGSDDDTSPPAATGATGTTGPSAGVTGGTAASTGLLSTSEDTSGRAQRGGTYNAFIATDAGGWDVHIRGAWFGTLGGPMWSRLTTVEPGRGEKSSGNIVGDLAEGWEVSGDGLTLTFRLKPNAHWHDIAPVNGRSVDADDVVATWNRWREFSNTRATIAHEFNPDAPVESITAPDERTVVMRLAFPAVTVPSLFSASVGQAFHIYPREADEAYDPRAVAIGSGPYALENHISSSRITLKRNESYHDAPLGYFDRIEYPILSEYAAALAAFKNGQLHQYAVRAEDILGTKDDVPELNMYATDLLVPSASLFFGYLPTEQSMFRDKRLRQAYSMSLDRDLFAEIWYNVPNFTSQGLPVDTAWSTAVPASEYTGWWLDPQGEAFGENAVYYRHDVAEAKLLMAAAGFPDGVDYISTRAAGNYGPTYDQQIDITEGMASDAGFRPVSNPVNYQTELIPNYQNVGGAFEGVAWMLRPQSSSDPIDKLAEYFFSGSGANFLGFDPDGAGDQSGDPVIDDLIQQSRIETDPEARLSIMHALQRHAAGEMYLIRELGGATSFELAWPQLKNFLFFRGARRSEEVHYFWLEQG